MSKPSAKDGDDARRIEEGVRVATTTELAHDSQEKDVTRQSIQEVDPDSHSDLSRSAGRPDVPDHYHNEMEGNSMVQKDRSRYHGSPIKRVYRAIATWISGPQPPRPFSINPFFPRFQSAPLRLLNTLLRGSRQRKGLYIVFCLVWLIIFASVLHSSVFGCSVPGFGSNVQRVSCSTKFW